MYKLQIAITLRNGETLIDIPGMQGLEHEEAELIRESIVHRNPFTTIKLMDEDEED